MFKVRKIEHHTSSHTKDNGENGDGIGMNAQLFPHQCKGKSYGSGEVNIKPFLGVLRLVRRFQQFLKTSLFHFFIYYLTLFRIRSTSEVNFLILQ